MYIFLRRQCYDSFPDHQFYTQKTQNLENQIFSSLLKLHKVTLYLKSTQYKKLAPNALWFTSCKSHEKIKQRTSDSSFQFFINKSITLMFFVLFFHVVCKISNFNMWTTKHLAQASCTELTLNFFLNFIWYFFVKHETPQPEIFTHSSMQHPLSNPRTIPQVHVCTKLLHSCYTVLCQSVFGVHSPSSAYQCEL